MPTRSTTAANAESGSALVIGNSIAGGILNNGPSSASDTATVAANITGNGFSAPTILITPEAGVPVNIGQDIVDVNGAFSFINRGTITAQPEDPNKGTRTIVIGGSTAALPVTFAGGFFNSGIITANATSVSPGSLVNATALEIDNYVTIPRIYLSAQSVASGGSTGTLAASINGPQGGIAAGIVITGQPISGVGITSVPEIDIERGARIIVSASATDPTSTAVTTLAAVGIQDVSIPWLRSSMARSWPRSRP